jgi:osmotically-inducible protein OsmY
MHASKISLMIGALILVGSLGAGGCASRVQRPATVATQISAADEQLADKVQAALHADPYLYDKHIDVSIEFGNVVLRGFVSNSWDLVDANKIAIKAAGGRHVVDYLSIKPIEERESGPRR